MISDFQIEEYHTKRLHADVISISKPINIELQYFATCSSEYLNGQWRGEVRLGFRQLPEGTDDTSIEASIYEVIIDGKFSMRGDNNDEDREQFTKRLKINGASTLIPIARAAMASTTAIMGYPNKLLIPNISVGSIKWKDENVEEK